MRNKGTQEKHAYSNLDFLASARLFLMYSRWYATRSNVAQLAVTDEGVELGKVFGAVGVDRATVDTGKVGFVVFHT